MPVANLGARAGRPRSQECMDSRLRGNDQNERDARAPRTRRPRESGIWEPEAGRRTILRRFVEDFHG